jgi:uncharacterized membrane protein
MMAPELWVSAKRGRRRRLLSTLMLAATAYGCNAAPKHEGSADTLGKGGAASASAAVPAPGTPAFHAVGTEPFWSLDIGPSGLRFTTPEDSAGIRTPAVPAEARGDSLHWSAAVERASLDVMLWPGDCSDGMSDRVWKYHAAVRVDTTAYRGCAELRAP